MLGVPDFQDTLPAQMLNPVVLDETIRSQRFDRAFDSFVQLSAICEETVRLYGPALLEHRNVHDALVRVQTYVSSEQPRWDIYQSVLGRETAKKTLRTPDDPRNRVPTLVPSEALSNLLALAVAALGLVAATTRVIDDWDDLPPERDERLEAVFMGWPIRDT